MMMEVTPTPATPSARRRSHGNLVVAVLRGCAAVLVFSLGLYFVLDARSLWTQRDEIPGEEGLQWFAFPIDPLKCFLPSPSIPKSVPQVSPSILYTSSPSVPYVLFDRLLIPYGSPSCRSRPHITPTLSPLLLDAGVTPEVPKSVQPPVSIWISVTQI
ncbi:hypothetical protein CIB84_017301 [Bambusicola thoracicus]|uniref:Uncharacterized protein n=1 Tax=Bambusicola thoracicus TaxID=9083 RepID=A0A2P4S487_BAMTH|nr:hypothetical protein CIB84_017301 [Bambusicola thoracicus]